MSTALVGSKAGAWANQALDYALNMESPYVAVSYMKPPSRDPHEAGRWYVTPMQTRNELDRWYQGLVGAPERYHYLAAFDKTTAAWDRGDAVAAMVTDHAPHVGAHLAPEAYRPAALHAVARRARENDPRTWLYVALESGNSMTKPHADYAGALNELGAYFRSAAAGMMENVSYWAVLAVGPSGPEILHDGSLAQTTSVGASPREHLHHLDRIVGQHETFWAEIAQRHPTHEMREFLQQHWDPYLSWWWVHRPYFDTEEGKSSPGFAGFVREASLDLSRLRDLAAYNGIPTPDLGTTQHGVIYPEGLKVSGSGGTSYNGGRPGGSAMHSRHPRYHDPQVGHWLLPLALGVPAGALGGYFYRRWQEGHPGKYIPWIGAEAHVPHPGTATEILRRVAPEVAHRTEWPTIHKLIQSAIHEVRHADASADWGVPWVPTAYVWGLRADGTTELTPAPSREGGLADVRDRTQEEGIVALALFDKTSPHWPNPVTWTTHHEAPVFYAAVDAYLGTPAPSVSGYPFVSIQDLGSPRFMPYGPWTEIVGGGPWDSIVGGGPWDSIIGGGPWDSIVGGGEWVTIIGQTLDVLRKQAQVAVEEMPSRVIGVIRDADNRWVLKSFKDADIADDWFGHATRDRSRFTYAAYFDKGDPLFPYPLNEKIGGAHAPAVAPSPIPRVIAET